MITKKVIYVTALLMAGICTATPVRGQVKEPQALSLSDCFEYAFRNSYNLRKSALDVQESDAAHRETNRPPASTVGNGFPDGQYQACHDAHAGRYVRRG